MSEEIPYAYQLRHHEQEVERLGTEIDRQRVKTAKLKELMPVWVSVDERLPDDKQRVLYYFEYVGIHVGKYDSNDNCFYGSSGFLQDDVTHWMPLPPAPNEAVK